MHGNPHTCFGGEELPEIDVGVEPEGGDRLHDPLCLFLFEGSEAGAVVASGYLYPAKVGQFQRNATLCRESSLLVEIGKTEFVHPDFGTFRLSVVILTLNAFLGISHPDHDGSHIADGG